MTAPKPEVPPAPETASPFEGLVPGRIVWYHPTSAESRYASPGPWPSMVTKVGENGVVTLNVNMPSPTPIGTDPVARLEKVAYTETDKDGAVTLGCWGWMFAGQGTRYRSEPPSALPKLKPA